MMAVIEVLSRQTGKGRVIIGFFFLSWPSLDIFF